MPTNRNTLEQGRAAFAYKCATKAANQTKTYRPAVKKLPMYIQTNGLGAALAFYSTKHQGIYKDIAEWLRNEDCIIREIVNLPNEADLMERLVNMQSEEYRATTIEVMALVAWLRRFAGDAEDETTTSQNEPTDAE